MTSRDALATMRRQIWEAKIPLEIKIASAECRTYDQVEPYLVACTRLSYLPSLVPKLLKFFSPHLIIDSQSLSSESGCFLHETIPLKWHLPVGLLYDIYVLSAEQVLEGNGAYVMPPFRLTIHFTAESLAPELRMVPLTFGALHDAFINSVKEADFLRSGTAKPIMSLSAADSRLLWSSTQEGRLLDYAKVYDALIPIHGQVRNIPLRIYIPSSVTDDPSKNQIKVLQGQISPFLTSTVATTTTSVSQLRGPSTAQIQTVGTALHALIPTLFPSRRTPVLAKPILHGSQVPMAASLEDLARKCSYADGWINIVVVMTT